MEIILIGNEKGGSTKTTTVISLANCLKALGYRVLAVDMDPSGNLTCAALPEAPLKVLHDVFIRSVPMQDAIVKTEICDILPTAKETPMAASNAVFNPLANLNSKSLGQIADRLVGQAGAEYILASLLRNNDDYNLADHYDFVLLDIGPSDNILVRNAIVAADSIIIPVDPFSSSLDGLVMFINSVRSVQHSYKTDVKVEGVLFTKYKEDWGCKRTTIRDIEEAAEYMGLRCFNTRIRESSNFPDSMYHCRPILDYANRSGNAVEDTMNLALEFLAVRGLKPRADFPGVQADSEGTLHYTRPKRDKKAKKPVAAQ